MFKLTYKVRTAAMMKWLARLSGKQGIRGSIAGPGTTDFCKLISSLLRLCLKNTHNHSKMSG